MGQEADKVIIGGGQTVLRQLLPDAYKVVPTLSWSGPCRSPTRGGIDAGLP